MNKLSNYILTQENMKEYRFSCNIDMLSAHDTVLWLTTKSFENTCVIVY